MKLSKVYKRLCHDITTLAVTNIDDVFRTLNDLEVTEIEVNREEMSIIVYFYLCNCGDQDKEKPKVLRENKLSQIFGVKLILNE